MVVNLSCPQHGDPALRSARPCTCMTDHPPPAVPRSEWTYEEWGHRYTVHPHPCGDGFGIRDPHGKWMAASLCDFPEAHYEASDSAERVARGLNMKIASYCGADAWVLRQPSRPRSEIVAEYEAKHKPMPPDTPPTALPAVPRPDLEAIQRVAEKSAPADWTLEQITGFIGGISRPYGLSDGFGHIAIIDHSSAEFREYLETVTPDVVLALLAYIRRLEAEAGR